LGSFPLSNRRGNRRGNGRGNGEGNGRGNGEGNGEGNGRVNRRGEGKERSHLAARGNMSRVHARNALSRCVYGVPLGGFYLRSRRWSLSVPGN